MPEHALVPQPLEDDTLPPAPASSPQAHDSPRATTPSPDPDPDLAHLALAISRGDESALAALYEAWFDRAVLLAASITRRAPAPARPDPLDIVQDAFIRIVRSIRPMPTPADVERWLVRVIKSTALDHLRREARRLARETRHARGQGASSPSPADLAALADQIAALRARLDALTPEDAALLSLRFAHHHTLERAAAAADAASAPAAHGRIRRALDHLRRSAGSLFHER